MDHSTVRTRTRTRLSRATAVLPTSVLVVLAAPALGCLQRPAPTPSTAPSGVTVTVALLDTPAGRAFAEQAPVPLRWRDLLGQAKAVHLSTPLPVADDERVLDPVVGGVYYWPPSGDVAVFYEDLGQTVPPPGLVPLGTVTEGLDAVAGAGRSTAVTVHAVRAGGAAAGMPTPRAGLGRA
jgi:hypothetical protein